MALKITDHKSGFVTEPGFYRMSAAQYHADPCPQPSLSSSIAKILLRRTPAHAYAAHSRYTPQEESTPTSAMLFGSAVHKLVLGEGAKIAVIDAEDYRKQSARDARDEAIARGQIPLLNADFDRADLVAEKMGERIKGVAGARDVFVGERELVAVWREGETWCRAMFDCIDHDFTRDYGAVAYIDDLKTSAQDFGPANVGKLISNMGYEISHEFYTRGVRKLIENCKVHFRFAFVETSPPFEAAIVQLDGAAIEHGRRQVCAAIALWQRCQLTGKWPGYPRSVVRAEIPGYAVAAWEARETDDPMLEGIAY